MTLSQRAVLARRRYHRALVAGVVLAVVFTVLLCSPLPAELRRSATSVGMILAGTLATISGGLKAWSLWRDRSRRGWLMLATAGPITIVGNVWAAAVGSDPVTSPSRFANLCIVVSLILAVLALWSFPGLTVRRGPELVVMLLDGVVTGGAFLLIASVLVFPRMLSAASDGFTFTNALNLAFPVLDIVLATFAVLLIVRSSRADRLMLALVATAFLLYAASDLAFAVYTAERTFHFGTPLDLGWIIGWLVLAVAAWAPTREVSADDNTIVELADALGTTTVFGVLVVATLVQVIFGSTQGLNGIRSVVWVLILLAAGVRQTLLTLDNAALRRGLEHRVREQTADLRTLARQNHVLLTSVGEGIYGVDQAGIVTFVNPSAATLLGYRADQLVGASAHTAFHAPDAQGSPLPWSNCYVHRAIDGGVNTQAAQGDYIRADGSRLPVELTAAPLLDDDEVRGAVVVFRDVTQRREVDNMKNEFMSVVSHELRTPLTSIQGSLGLLASGRLGDLPDRAGPLVDVALRSSQRVTRLVNDLLDLERLQSGSAAMDFKQCDAGQLLATAATQIDGMATSLGVRVQIDAAEGWVLADGAQIVQTLLNLLNNAVTYSEPGSVVRLTAGTWDDEVHFTVSDRGRGIPADKLESVFDRFEQIQTVETREPVGTGLGLTISRGIVTRHGGRIWAESELGAWTVMHFTVPRTVPGPVAEPVTPRQASALR